jgi:catechol 2,3-dioxygenase-like lactoylglutathione lyase family enzyme
VRISPPPDDSQRTALKFGTQKINLHAQTRPFDPKAHSPTAGSADMCFLTDMPLTDWTAHLATHNIHIEQGPVARTGATGPILSIYLRDPDGNLVEIAQPQ